MAFEGDGESPNGEEVFQWTEASLLRSAVRYLQRFPASKNHFLRVMNRKIRRTFAGGADPEQPYDRWLGEVVKRCESLGLLDDEALAKALATSLHRRGVSLRAMRQRMRRKGLGEGAVEDAIKRLHENADSPDLSAALSYARRRRLGPYGPDSTRHERYRKDLQKLARQGFSFGIAKQVLEAELEEITDDGHWN